MEKPNNKTEDQKVKRYFGLTNLAVDNSVSIFIVAAMIVLFGIQAYQSMPKETYPEVSFPQIFVNTPYFGNSAAEIENLVSRPLEKEIQGVTGIKNVNSTSMQDYSIIIAEFESDVDIEDAKRKVKDAVDIAKSELPDDISQDPFVTDINLSEIPIMTVNVSGDYDNVELKSYAEYLEDKLEDIEEVSDVDMKGALEREVKIDVDVLKMQAREISYGDIANAIASENINMSGGEMVNNEFRRAVRVVGEFESVDELEELIVKSEYQKPVYLKEIAEVNMGYKERTSYARSDQLPVISLDIIKRKGANMLDASDRVKEIVEAAEEVLPEGVTISIFNDQSIYTRNEVDNLLNSIISGVILVILVLLFFLGLRNSLFVGIAIPLSMLMGILWLNFTGVTMNIVVLFSLILALGLLVDNAIVTVENIYRYMQNGHDGVTAAKLGAGEVAVPIIASTATTLAAFLPLAFWPGLMGDFMKYLPITLIIVLTSSLFVALVVNPVFTSKFMKVDKKSENKAVYNRKRKNLLIGTLVMLVFAVGAHLAGVQWIRNILGIAVGVSLLNFFILRPASFSFQNKGLPVLERAYNRFIRFALNKYNPSLFFGGTIALLFVALFLLGVFAPKIIFFPSADPLYVNAFVELPLGRDIEATNRSMKDLEDKVTKIIEPYNDIVEAVLSQIGENTSDPNMPPEPGASPHKARLTITFVESRYRGGVNTFDVMEDIRSGLDDIPGIQIVVDKNADGPPTGKPINIELKGEDVNVLASLSNDIIDFINAKNIGGIEELKADVNIGKPEMIINIDRKAARRYEVSTFAIADAIRTSIFGKEVSKFKDGEDEYPIQLRMSESNRNKVEDLLNQKITFRNMATGQISQVPVNSVASFDYNSTYSSIKRKNADRMITVFSNVLNDYNPNEVVANIQAEVTDFDMPPGYSIKFTGEQEEQAKEMEFLSSAFTIAILSIFLIIVAQFNSVISPFIIVLSILFSTIGVFLGYIITGKDIVVIFTGVGIISLAGVVVNNAIVLIDYINLVIKRKREALGVTKMNQLSNADIKDAIIQGGATRLRPVLLTAITTVLGLVPLAIGFNFNFFTLISELDPKIFIGGDNTAMWGPMAWTIIYGLVFATFLTLVIVPVMYWLAYSGKTRIMNLFTSKPKKDLKTV